MKPPRLRVALGLEAEQRDEITRSRSSARSMNRECPERVPILLMVRELGIGGTERQLVETARFLQGDRFLPHVGCFRPNGLRTKDLERAGIPIFHLPVYSFKSPAVLKAASQLIRYIRDNHIQIVHSFDAPLNVFAVPIARIAGTPAVISSQRGHRVLTGAHTRRLLRVTDRIADAVVVNCEAMRRYLVEEEGVAENKVRLCYNGIDTDRYQRRSIPPPFPGRLVIGGIGALRPEKGFNTLIQAFATLGGLGAKLVVVGSGPEEGRLRALSSQLGVEEDCYFEPATTQVAERLSGIDIFVLPSRFEALSNALMEAMACRCCTIASRVGGNPELIDHARNGLLFQVDNVAELASQLRGLLNDEGRRKRFAAAASDTIRSRFTFSKAASAMQEIYDSVLSGRHARLGRPTISSG